MLSMQFSVRVLIAYTLVKQIVFLKQVLKNMVEEPKIENLADFHNHTEMFYFPRLFADVRLSL